MKNLFLTLTITLVFTGAISTASAHVDDIDDINDNSIIEPCEVGSVIRCGDHGFGNSQTIDEVLNDLLIGFDAQTPDDLECSQIIEHDFSHMGEAIMLYMHPDKDRLHSIIDALGGEGSDSLANTRAEIGKRYLGCEDAEYGPLMMHNLYNAQSLFSSQPKALIGPHMLWRNQSWMFFVWVFASIGFAYSVYLVISSLNKK